VLEVLQAPVEIDWTSHKTRVHSSLERSPPSTPAHYAHAPEQRKAQRQPPHFGVAERKAAVAPVKGGGDATHTQRPCARTGLDVIGDHSVPLGRRLLVVFGQWRRIDVTAAWVQACLLMHLLALTAPFSHLPPSLPTPPRP